jgi:hypothetical protein
VQARIWVVYGTAASGCAEFDESQANRLAAE